MAMAASSSTAASASTSANPNGNSNSFCDIFINHRGPDVKKTFASYLYHRLNSHGLKVFLDKEELQQGDYINSQIDGAIRSASVHVAIFSARYAESTWCLNELVSMLESKAPLIPVFYDVKPAELRWTDQRKDGVYAQALHKLKEKTNKARYDPVTQTQQETLRHDSETVEQWRNALSSVAGISGFELEACNGDEGVLLEKVVDCVLRKVKKTAALNVAKYPTGLDEKVKDFENKVFFGHKHSGLVGIVGLGGAGKTTLAKELFNLKRSHYKNSCFFFDVRETVAKGSLTTLQSNLLQSLRGSTLQIDNKDKAIEELKSHLPSSEILLILDDVDHVDQVDALLPDQTSSLHSNSLILITSRNKDVLTNSGVKESSIYKIDGLSEQHSLELFCCHAFSQPCPFPGFESLTKQFIKACRGLPLSLKVFGALLRGKNDMSYWRDQLASLYNTLPSDIQERLKISYDTLDNEEKHIFLDIACFLIGHERNKAISIWDASGWNGRLRLQNLQNKCLVEVEVEYEWDSKWDSWESIRKIKMHDHLRDLGRNVAGSSLPRRLWRWTENVIGDLFQQSCAIPVRGIRMVLGDYHEDDGFDSIEMSRLQLVDTEGFLLERILRRVEFPNLIWLCWKKCPYSSFPSWIPMKNLRALQVSGSALKTLWQPESQLPVYLEELRVEECQNLKSLSGLEQGTKIQRLDVSGCSELEWLPNMETLICLKELKARRCVKLKTLRGLEQATKLQRLDVSGCSELEELPNMETLVSLEQLNASLCVKLKSIRGLEQATKLKLLDVSWCYELKVLPNMETLVYLEKLSVKGCVELKSIRGLEQATKLKKLSVYGSSKLEELPSMERFVSLKSLLTEGCVKLKRIQWLKGIQGLEQETELVLLNVNGCSELEELTIETLVSLENLVAYGCKVLKRIQGLEQATKLQTLDVDRCYELEELPSLETLVFLEELSACDCVKLKVIHGLEQATKLEVLNVDGCYELEELPSLETLVSLVQLSASNCVKLKVIQGLEQATKLRELHVGGCVMLKSIQGVEQATKLQRLDVRLCYELEALPSMETLVSLEELLADGCVKLKSIRGLLQCTKLRNISVTGCCELEEVEDVEHCTWLCHFDFCPKLVSGVGGVRVRRSRSAENGKQNRRADIHSDKLFSLGFIGYLVVASDQI